MVSTLVVEGLDERVVVLDTPDGLVQGDVVGDCRVPEVLGTNVEHFAGGTADGHGG